MRSTGLDYKYVASKIATLVHNIVFLKKNLENKEQIQHILLAARILAELFFRVSSDLKAFFEETLVSIIQIQTYIWKFQLDYRDENIQQNRFQFWLTRQ